jgi:hypothetical protein
MVISNQLSNADDSQWIPLEKRDPVRWVQSQYYWSVMVATMLAWAVCAHLLRSSWAPVGVGCFLILGLFVSAPLLSGLSPHRRRVRRVFGACAASVMRRASIDQPFTVRAQQAFKESVHVHRINVSLGYVERIVTDSWEGQILVKYVSEHQIWTTTKTTAFEGRFFPADGVCEVLTEFDVPAEAGLARAQKARRGWSFDDPDTERRRLWQVRIDTIRTDGLAVTSLFTVPFQECVPRSTL